MAVSNIRPQSYEEFRNATEPKQETCVNCEEAFAPANTQTAAGWRETQISGFCENCFDAIFADGDDE